MCIITWVCAILYSHIIYCPRVYARLSGIYRYKLNIDLNTYFVVFVLKFDPIGESTKGPSSKIERKHAVMCNIICK